MWLGIHVYSMYMFNMEFVLIYYFVRVMGYHCVHIFGFTIHVKFSSHRQKSHGAHMKKWSKNWHSISIWYIWYITIWYMFANPTVQIMQYIYFCKYEFLEKRRERKQLNSWSMDKKHARVNDMLLVNWLDRISYLILNFKLFGRSLPWIPWSNECDHM